MRLGIPALGIVSSLGRGKAENARALFAGNRDGMVGRDDLIPGQRVVVGAVTGDLPPVPAHLSAWQCRNNSLVYAALTEIMTDVEALIHRFGRARIAVVMGTSTSGIAEGETAFAERLAHGTWPARFDYRQQEAGGLAGFVAKALDITGPAYTIATACSSSGKVFGSARRLIRAGLADAVIVGGADTLCRLTLNGFSALEAVSHGHCQPFSHNRDGINIGEAAAVFVVTAEESEINLLGLGEASDAHHISAPDPEGKGAIKTIRAALDDAHLTPADIAYVNLHGTGTKLNDAMESGVIHTIFGPQTPCSSTKAITGHTLGAAGACEAAFLWLTLNRRHNPESRLPPHIWDGVPDPEISTIALTTAHATFPQSRSVAMLSNSFAFGGSNVALVLGRGKAP